jgi:hypothetical protein
MLDEVKGFRSRIKVAQVLICVFKFWTTDFGKLTPCSLSLSLTLTHSFSLSLSLSLSLFHPSSLFLSHSFPLSLGVDAMITIFYHFGEKIGVVLKTNVSIQILSN